MIPPASQAGGDLVHMARAPSGILLRELSSIDRRARRKLQRLLASLALCRPLGLREVVAMVLTLGGVTLPLQRA